MNPLEKVLARMAELKPRIEALGNAEELTDEQRSEWSTVTDEWRALEARKADLEERAAMAERASKVTYRPAVPGTEDTSTDIRSLERSGELRTHALRAVDKAKHLRSDMGDSVVGILERDDAVGEYAAKLVLATGTPEYRASFRQYLKTGRVDEQIERAWSHTTTAVGAVIPWTLDPSLILTGAGASNPFRQISRVVQIGPTRDGWNGATVAQVTSGYLGAASAFSDNAPATTVPNIPVYKYGCYIPISFEAFEDTDLATDVAMLLADSRDNLEATSFATGTGSSEPTGVSYAVAAVTASRVSATTGGAFAVADIYKVHQALPARHRLGANAANRSWIASVTMINNARQFATANNYHGFLTDLGGGQPPQLLGDQLHESSAMSSTSTTGQDVLLYGNFSRFVIVDRIGMSIEFIPNVVDGSGLPTGQRAWLMHGRHGSNVTDAAAFRQLRL